MRDLEPLTTSDPLNPVLAQLPARCLQQRGDAAVALVSVLGRQGADGAGQHSRAVDPGAHAVLMLHGAKWHIARDLDIPDHIALLRLPTRAPDLDPVQNVWQVLRDNWFGDRIFTSQDDIVDRCCDAWNRLAERPWKIISLGLRDGTHRC